MGLVDYLVLMWRFVYSKSRLLTLSDFWDCDGTKSQEEMMRIRLEEERFRREV